MASAVNGKRYDTNRSAVPNENLVVVCNLHIIHCPTGMDDGEVIYCNFWIGDHS